MIPFRAINVAIVCMVIIMIRSEFHIPDVKFEILKQGGFRAYIPENEYGYRFSINIKINAPLGIRYQADLECHAWAKLGYHAVESKKKLKMYDYLYYYVETFPFSVNVPKAIFFMQVGEVLDSYQNTSSMDPIPCKEVLFYDGFVGDSVNQEKWTIEHKIPTYSGPRFVFNSYLNSSKTVFKKKSFLHLQPIAVTNEDDVKGTLNLGSSCTSSILYECMYSQGSTFLLPPVKSAMLRSRRTFRYGKFQIRAKLPVGDWIFPIIQLARPRPTIDHVSVDELWIAFSRGNQVLLGTNMNENLTRPVLFAGPVDNADEPLRSKKLVSYNATSSFSDYFHYFELRWYPDKLQFFVDEEPFGELNSDLGSLGTSGDNLEYELQIGVGIGGLIDFPDGVNNKPWNNSERNYMKKFFEDKVNKVKINWLKTWNGQDTALKVDWVKVTAP